MPDRVLTLRDVKKLVDDAFEVEANRDVEVYLLVNREYCLPARCGFVQTTPAYCDDYGVVPEKTRFVFCDET
jgi:hypothetical protein